MNKSKQFGLIAAFGVASLLVACSEDTTTNNYTTTAIEDYTFKNLPDCDRTTDGKVAFVTNKEQLMYCSDGEWLNLNGEDGEKGEQGKQGEKGEDGDDCKASILPDSTGYKITCGTDSVGVVKNGAKGEVGEKGDNGESCSMKKFTNKKDTAAVVICKKDTVWLLNGKDASATGDNGESGDNGGNGGNNPDTPEDNQNTPTEGSMPNGLVIIGNQVWKGQNENNALKGGACYNNDENNCNIFGRLYTWAEAMDLDTSFDSKSSTLTSKKNYQGICPEGFHIPTSLDWNNLKEYINSKNPLRDSIIKKNDWFEDADISGVLLRGTTYNSNDEAIWGTFEGLVNAIDYYGFMVVGAGMGNKYWNYNEEKNIEIPEYGSFDGLMTYSYYWSNMQLADHNYAYAHRFNYDQSNFDLDDWLLKTNLASVRCMMNMTAEDYKKTEEYKALVAEKK